MPAADAHVNTPAAAWAWLTHQLAGLAEDPRRSVTREWSALRSERNGRRTAIGQLTDWPSDFWIAKTQATYGAHLGAVWSVPERIDQWPLLDVEGVAADALADGSPTNCGALLGVLAAGDPAHLRADVDPVRRFAALAQAAAHPGDQAMIAVNQVGAWLTTAFGDLLAEAALTPTDDVDPEFLAGAVADRLTVVGSADFRDWRVDLVDFGCESLYCSSMTEHGPQRSGTRQGQGPGWQHHWVWLSTPQDAGEMRATLQLTGLLLASGPMLAGLVAVMDGGDEEARRRAVCVARRWLLTAKALAWLFEALHHDWTDTRPQDLACFAFGALSPAWPRRSVALSHRSAEVKPLLGTLRMWNSPHTAVDASYVPAWETNTGMIWSLFAAVPVLVRVGSPAYSASEWCRREHEVFQYLLDGADFLEGRTVVDLDVDRLPELDNTLFEEVTLHFDDDAVPHPATRRRPLPAPRDEFPPFSLVLVGRTASDLDGAVLRAGGALRLINAMVRQPAVANEFARLAADGVDLEIEPPTNNPDGWAAYGEIFRTLRAALPPDERSVVERLRRRRATGALPITVPEDYPAEDTEWDRLRAHQIPDLGEGRYRLADVLAAWEWQRVVFAAFAEEGFGDKVLVDVSDLTVQQWASAPDASIARGLLSMTGPSPTWIVQQAGQNAHTWPGFREQPIFTRHRDDQFGWIKPVLLDPRWLIHYLANSGLALGPGLQATVIASVAQAIGSDALRFEEHDGDLGLQVPTPREFFVVPTDALQDLFALMEDPDRPPQP